MLAVFLCAAMSSTASELNALAATSLLDVFGRFFPETTNTLWLSRLFTVFWGVLAIAFALAASLFDNLIQLVNILGSLFYGTILGVFLVAFYLPRIGAKEVLIAAILSEMLTLCLFFLPKFFPNYCPILAICGTMLLRVLLL
ncbi:MAG: hypothetical protein R2798_13035 [Chitinophagales bacterium]